MTSNATIPDLPPHLHYAALACAVACRDACTQLQADDRGAVLVFDDAGGMPRTFEHDARADAAAQLAMAPPRAGRCAVLSWFVRLHRPDGPLALALHVEPAAGEPAVFVSEVQGPAPFTTWQRVSGEVERIGREVVLS